MKCSLLPIVFVSPALASSQPHDHGQKHAQAIVANADIVVTINPEIRVSAVLAAPVPALLRKCGNSAEFKVRVVNQGFTTARLRAAVVGEGKDRVTLHMDATKLSGKPEDLRLLHLTPFSAGATDVTIAFTIDNNFGDPGGGDQVHLLLRCSG